MKRHLLSEVLRKATLLETACFSLKRKVESVVKEDGEAGDVAIRDRLRTALTCVSDVVDIASHSIATPE